MGLSKEQKVTGIAIIAGFALLLISYPLDNLLNAWMQEIENPVLTYFFGWTSIMLSMVFLLLIMTSLFMWEEHKRDWIIPLWLSFWIALAVSYVIKFIVERERPIGEMLIFGLPDYSFPSTHAAVSFSVIPVLDKEYPMLKWFWVLFAVLVSLGRLYTGAHWLSDVIAGALLGYCIGKTILYIKKKYGAF